MESRLKSRGSRRALSEVRGKNLPFDTRSELRTGAAISYRDIRDDF